MASLKLQSAIFAKYEARERFDVAMRRFVDHPGARAWDDLKAEMERYQRACNAMYDAREAELAQRAAD